MQGRPGLAEKPEASDAPSFIPLASNRENEDVTNSSY